MELVTAQRLVWESSEILDHELNSGRHSYEEQTTQIIISL
jgi:hypothetical protein